MTDEVRAAIERLLGRMQTLADLGEHQVMNDIVRVLAEVERLRAKVIELDSRLEDANLQGLADEELRRWT